MDSSLSNIAVVFDMDGVLIDSQPLHYEIDMQVLKSCGYPAELSTVTPYSGVSNPDRWAKYKETLNLEQSIEQLIQITEQKMLEVFQSGIVAIEGVKELLAQLQNMNIPCGVASSSPHSLIQLVLNNIGIKQYFSEIISGEDVKIGKPDPDIYITAAKKMGFSPNKCIAIEDAPFGIQSANAAGFTCIAYKNPNTYGQVFTHAHYVIENYTECLPIIEKIRCSI